MRSTALLFLLISVFCVQSARSQSDELIVQGQTGKLYLLHTVLAKDNWYSIGRTYNISPKELAPYNELTLDKPLSIGQQVKVPLTAVNFSQSGQKPATTETLVPLYYIIQEKEWMYRISVNHNKVPIPNLEKWNNINKDQVKAGMPLIVGFLKVKTAQSALAKAAIAPPAGSGDKAVTDNKVTNNKTDHSTDDHVTATPPVVKTDNTMTPKLTADNKAVVSKPVAAVPQPVATGTVSKFGTTGAATTTVKPVPTTAQPTAMVAQPSSAPHFNGGFFSSDFSESGRSVSGPASTFKSTSGWQDGKYYALMNNVPVGTIVKINVPSTNKTVYAKILGQLPDMKESAGLTIRMSNAAAGELGEGDGKFSVEVKY